MPTQISDEMLDEIVDNITNAQGEDIATALLLGASTLLETAGYELARTHGSALATRVILQSSEVEKLAISLVAERRKIEAEARDDEQ